MSMYFYDETDDWPEYQVIKEDIQRLERQHFELCKEMREAQAALESDPADEILKAKADRLGQKLKAVEKRLDQSLSLYR